MAQDEPNDTHKKEGDVWNHIQRIGDPCKTKKKNPHDFANLVHQVVITSIATLLLNI